LADEDEERELEEEFRQLLLEEEGEEKPIFSFDNFPPLLSDSKEEDSSEKEQKEEESCEKQVATEASLDCSIESGFYATPMIPLSSSLSESLICQVRDPATALS
jgi:hypothetical protein